MIRPFRGRQPRIAASAYIDPSAQVIGDVEVGERSSIWPNATVRGDVNYIRIGEETNIQDNCCLHVELEKHPLILGNRVTVGHSVTLHGCEIEAEVPPGSVVMGVPARVRRHAGDAERERIRRSAANYVRYREICKDAAE